MADRNRGSESPNIDEWMHGKGTVDQSKATAIKKSLAEQISKALEEESVSKAELARRMKTSRPVVDRLLDPKNQSVTLATLQKVARSLGRELQLELLGNWISDPNAKGMESSVPSVLVRSPTSSSRSKRSRIERLVGTVFFEVSADKIVALNEHEIVELMRRLVFADLTDTGIPLRGSTIPAQIHIPDGGEDGRIRWSGGSNETQYLPSRFCILQSKAGDPGPSGLRSEVINEGAGAVPKLKPAISELLENCGSYIVVIGSALTGQKIKNRKQAIRKGIEDAGEQPDKLAEIEIYDANMLADWVNIHPSIALWINEKQKRIHLSGFQSYLGWGQDTHIANHHFLDMGECRFLLRDPAPASNQELTDRAVTFTELKKDVVAFLSAPQKSLRIIGASGYGKSRLAFELFSLDQEDRDRLDARSVVFAQYEDIKDRLGAIALDLANSGASTILVVDDCPDDAHRDVLNKANREGSLLRVVTTDVSLKTRSNKNCRVVEVAPASKQLIEKIVDQAVANISQIDKNFVAELADGFPRMAILGACAVNEGFSALRTVDDLVQRILWGRNEPNLDALNLIEMLSLFMLIGIDREVVNELESVATACGADVYSFRNHMRYFKERGILVGKGDYIEVQHLPLAIRLGSDKIETLGRNGLMDLYKQVTPTLQQRFLRQLKWFDQLTVAKDFGRSLLREELADYQSVNCEDGSRLIDSVMHVDPDFAMETLQRLLGSKSIGDLQFFSSGRRYVVVALQKLVFRESSFYQAATLLRRLGAAETENWSNNAAGIFEGLYKLYLSGTEAGLEPRLMVIDDGLNSENESERSLCVKALGAMLDRHHFTRPGGNEQIGSGPPMQDWQPKTGKDIINFHLAGLNRLTAIACSDDSLAQDAQTNISTRIRGLLSVPNFSDQIRQTILAVNSAKGFWPEAIMAIGDWLFFDRKGAPPQYASKVRGLYDELLNLNLQDQVILYTKGWQSDLHDPDANYSDADERDWQYAEKRALVLAEQVAEDQDLLVDLTSRLTKQRLHGVFPFAKRLAQCVSDRIFLVKAALSAVSECSPQEVEFRFFSGLVAGIDSESHSQALQAIEVLLSREDFGNGLISIIGGAKLDEHLLYIAADLVGRDLVTPASASTLSHGRGLDHLEPKQIAPFMDSLIAVGSEGVWAALEAAYMYQHGRDGMSRSIAEIFKKILLAPGLFKVKSRARLGALELGQSVKLLVRHGYVDNDFAKNLATQMLRLAEVEDYMIQLELDDAAQKILELLIADHPKEVWSAIQGCLEADDALASHRYSGLLGLDISASEGVPLLHGLPAEVYFEWMEEKPQERIAMVLGWLPITVKSEDGAIAWHPDLETFVEKYVKAPEDLYIISHRLHPSGGTGSLADQLEPYRNLISTWCDHPVPAVRQWAISTETRLREIILNERRRDANDNAMYF